MEWHVPGEEEMTAAQKMLDEFLVEELDTLTQFSRGSISLDRDQGRI
jgi:hypothetical protein